MANFLSPIFNEQTVTSAGAPAVGYKINTYQAGTSTAAATYTTSTGSTQQANPIVLNSRGAPDDVIWLAEGVSYKFVLTDADDVVIDTFDNIAGVNDTSSAAGEWTSSGVTPTYIGATSFSVVGDKTSDFLVGRRIRSTNTAGTTYSLITVSSYSSGTGLTTVTVTNDSGTLDAGLSAVDLAILTPTNPSLPNSAAARTALGVGSGAVFVLGDGTTATTQSAGDNSTKVATTAYADASSAAAIATLPTPGMVKLNSGTVSAAATLDIVMTSYTAYANKLLVLNSLVPVSATVDLVLRVSTNGGSSYDAGGSDYKWSSAAIAENTTVTSFGSTATTGINLQPATVGDAAGFGLSAQILMYQTTSAVNPRFQIDSIYFNATNGWTSARGMGFRTAAQDTDAVRLLFSSGNISTGSWTLYGWN